MRAMLLTLAFLASTGCGYHVAGKATLLPKGIETIAVPPFASNVTQYRLPDQLASAISHELTTRTRYHVLPSTAEADAVLNGNINSVISFPTVSDPATGRATSVMVQVVLSVTLTERKTGHVLYRRNNFLTKDYYEISTDPHQSFDESGPAFRRLSDTVAREVVSGIVENF
jgi:outer membrane lipopolysaccharide assembly protein LptE/RlpB